jgi:E3 ubiquitin-protein ligase BIG BROTHER-like protein
LEEESSSRIESLASRNSQTQSEGLLKEEIGKIQERQYKHKKRSELEDCAICCCVIVDNHLVKDLPCNHLYHAECLSKWLSKNTACPLCKFDISTLLKSPSSDKTIDAKDLDETK